MAENISPNVPNIEPPKVPADLEPAQKATTTKVAKSKGWKFWTGTVLGILLVGGAIFTGVFYSGKTSLFTGNLINSDIWDLANEVIESSKELSLDSIYIDDEVTYPVTGGSAKEWEANLAFNLKYDLDTIAGDSGMTADKLVKYLYVYESGDETNGQLVSLDEISGKGDVIINWKNPNIIKEIDDAGGKPAAIKPIVPAPTKSRFEKTAVLIWL